VLTSSGAEPVRERVISYNGNERDQWTECAQPERLHLRWGPDIVYDSGAVLITVRDGHASREQGLIAGILYTVVYVAKVVDEVDCLPQE
jgi:hypothetical protein